MAVVPTNCLHCFAASRQASSSVMVRPLYLAITCTIEGATNCASVLLIGVDLTLFLGCGNLEFQRSDPPSMILNVMVSFEIGSGSSFCGTAAVLESSGVGCSFGLCLASFFGLFGELASLRSLVLSDDLPMAGVLMCFWYCVGSAGGTVEEFLAASGSLLSLWEGVTCGGIGSPCMAESARLMVTSCCNLCSSCPSVSTSWALLGSLGFPVAGVASLLGRSFRKDVLLWQVCVGTVLGQVVAGGDASDWAPGG